MGKGKRLREQRKMNKERKELQEEVNEAYELVSGTRGMLEVVKRNAYVENAQCRFNIMCTKANGAAYVINDDGGKRWLGARDWDWGSVDITDEAFINGCVALYYETPPITDSPRMNNYPLEAAFEHWAEFPDKPLNFTQTVKNGKPSLVAVADLDIATDEQALEALEYAAKNGGYALFVSTADNRYYPAREDIEVYTHYAKYVIPESLGLSKKKAA